MAGSAVRAMILAAGLGTRLRPLSALCAKPAMPIRGVPVIAHALALLARHGVTEVVVNLHHLPHTVRDAVERHRPPSVAVHWAEERTLLGTGGGIKAVAGFLRESDPSIVVAGDTLLDVDLTAAVERHRARRDRYTLLLRADDPRARAFGTVGTDGAGCVRRIGSRLDLGGETASALFTGARIAASRALEGFPDADAFEDLTDWLGPLLRSGVRDVRADAIPGRDCTFVPVGTAREYLDANLAPSALSYGEALKSYGPGADARVVGGDVIVGRGAVIGAGATLSRVVVWPGERVPDGARAHDAVFAGGRFHACSADSDGRPDGNGEDGNLRAESHPGRGA